MKTPRTKRAQDALDDERKAQRMLQDPEPFGDVLYPTFWARLARILADELEKATK